MGIKTSGKRQRHKINARRARRDEKQKKMGINPVPKKSLPVEGKVHGNFRKRKP